MLSIWIPNRTLLFDKIKIFPKKSNVKHVIMCRNRLFDHLLHRKFIFCLFLFILCLKCKIFLVLFLLTVLLCGHFCYTLVYIKLLLNFKLCWSNQTLSNVPVFVPSLCFQRRNLYFNDSQRSNDEILIYNGFISLMISLVNYHINITLSSEYHNAFRK